MRKNPKRPRRVKVRKEDRAKMRFRLKAPGLLIYSSQPIQMDDAGLKPIALHGHREYDNSLDFDVVISLLRPNCYYEIAVLQRLNK